MEAQCRYMWVLVDGRMADIRDLHSWWLAVQAVCLSWLACVLGDTGCCECLSCKAW